MKAVIKSISILLFTVLMSCNNKRSEPQPKEEGVIDSVLEEEGQKVKEVNEGIREGFDESSEELKEKTKELLTDSITP